MCLIAILLLASGLANAQEAAMESLFGPANVSAFSGNMRLTVGVDRSGVVSTCQWPVPGASNQISGHQNDAGWALVVGDAGQTLAGEPWRVERQGWISDTAPIIETEYRMEDAHAVQTLFVHPDRDVLVAHIEVRGVRTGTPETLAGNQSRPTVTAETQAGNHSRPTLAMLRWRGGFAPNLRQTAEAAVLDALLPRADDSLAVARPARHAYACFCPAQRTNTAWKPQKAMLDKDLAKLGDGIWIECLSPDAVSVDAPGESLQIEARQDGEALSATVYVAFARTFEEVERTLDKAVERGYAGLRADVEAHWRVALQPSGVAEGPVLQDLLTIALCTAPGTGAVVRAPVSRPPLALCDARTGVWIAYALDRYTFHDAAARLLGFLAGGVRLASEPNRPRGSLPAALYADGKPATPDFVLDVEEAAWLVTALYRHGVHLDDTARAAWWTGVWPSVEAIGDLLASWRRADTGEPLPAYQPGHWRDGITMASVLIEYAGLESAAQIAQMLRKTPPPPWFERQRELDTLIRFRLVDQAALWEVEAPLAFWMRGVVPDYHPLWSGRVVGEGELRLIDLATAEAAFQPQWLPHPVWPDAYAAALNACAAKR